jgi:hypothetical protein
MEDTGDKKMEINRVMSNNPSLEGGGIEGLEKKIDSRDLDIGAVYADAVRQQPYDHKEEVAVRWRLDRRIMPILFFNVVLASVDKTSTATGAL